MEEEYISDDLIPEDEDPSNDHPVIPEFRPSWTTTVSNGFISCGSNISIEPILFLHQTALFITQVIIQNLYMDRACRITLQQSDEACGRLTQRGHQGGGSGELEIQVEKVVAQLMIYQNIIIAIPGIIVALYIGVWSDRKGNGFKLPMVLSLFSFTFSSLIVFLITLLPDLRPEFIFISLLPTVLTGGMTLSVCAFSYIGANVSKENRSFRISILLLVTFAGQPIGTMAGAWIFAWGSFTAVFLSSASLGSMAFLYTIFFMPETLPVPEEEEPTPNSSNPHSQVFSIKDYFSTLFKDRPDRKDRWLIILWITYVLREMILKSNDLIYLYVRNKLNWDEQIYSEFKTAGVILDLIGHTTLTLIGIKIFKLTDITIGFFSGLGFFTATFVFAFATQGWMMYLGTVIQMFCGLQTIVIRSMLSKCVETDEMGKLMSFIACTDASLPLIVSPLINMFYHQTIHVFPGAFYMIQSVLNAIIMLNFLYLFKNNYNSSIQNSVPIDS